MNAPSPHRSVGSANEGSPTGQGRGIGVGSQANRSKPPGKDQAKQEGTERPWFRRRSGIVGIAVAVVALGAGGLIWWLHARQYETTDDAFIDTHFVHISPQVSGRVSQVRVEDNQLVEASEVLVQLDPADFEVRLNQALAALGQAQSGLAQAVAQQAVNQANLEQSQADAQVAEATASNAAADLERYRALAKSAPAAVSRQQLDNATAQARTTAAQLNSAKKKVMASAAQLKAADSQITAAQAQVKSAEAQVAQARLDLGYTRITAPEDGWIARRTVTVGAYVATGQDLMALVPRRVWVTANFKETQLQHMRPGQPVDIGIDAYPDLAVHGHVDSIQRGSGPVFSLLPPENATGNYVKVVQRVPVKIVIDDTIPADHPVGPGLSVSPRVKIR